MTGSVETQIPLLPQRWRNTFLLFPFGDLPDKTLAGGHYKQLMIADVSYVHRDDGLAAMLVMLIGFESRKAASFLFVTEPDDRTSYYILDREGFGPGATFHMVGPYGTELQVPARDAFRRGPLAAHHAGHWFTGLVHADHFVTPEHIRAQGDEITFGSWFAYENEAVRKDGPRGDGALPYRLLNLGAHNPLRLPVIGSYFQALGQEWDGALPDDGIQDLFHNLEDHVAGATLPGGSPEFEGGGLRDQRQLQAYMATSPYLTHCDDATLRDIAPGLDRPGDRRLPEWTNRVHINGMTIGQALKPYRTEVFYNDEFSGKGTEKGPGRQLSRFYNYSQNATFAANVRQDEYLEFNDTQVFEYVRENESSDDYRLSCKMTIPGIGYPRSDFPKLFHSHKPAVLHGGHFHVPEYRTLSIVVSGELPRPMAGNPVTASIFWWLFYEREGADEGVFFSECDFHTPQFHDLSIVDYSRFVPNADMHTVNDALNAMPDHHVDACPTQQPDAKW